MYIELQTKLMSRTLVDYATTEQAMLCETIHGEVGGIFFLTENYVILRSQLSNVCYCGSFVIDSLHMPGNCLHDIDGALHPNYR